MIRKPRVIAKWTYGACSVEVTNFLAPACLELNNPYVKDNLPARLLPKDALDLARRIIDLWGTP